MKRLFGFLGIFALAAFLSAADAPAFKVSEFTFKQPAAWEKVQTASSMGKAQDKVTIADRKSYAVEVFYYFGPGDGGGVQANVQRWFGQFQEPRDKKSEAQTIGGHKVTFVQAEGTYLSGMPGGPTTPQPNSALRGAIIESDQGAVFVKMTGPAAIVKSAEGDFRKMVESALK